MFYRERQTERDRQRENHRNRRIERKAKNETVSMTNQQKRKEKVSGSLARDGIGRAQPNGTLRARKKNNNSQMVRRLPEKERATVIQRYLNNRATADTATPEKITSKRRRLCDGAKSSARRSKKKERKIGRKTPTRRQPIRSRQ